MLGLGLDKEEQVLAGGESDGFSWRWLLRGEGEGQGLWEQGWWLGETFA